MKIKNPSISILVNSDFTTIEIMDNDAATTFVRVTLTPVQLSQCLSRLSHTQCDAEVFNLEKVGTVHKNQKFEFEITDKLKSNRITEELNSIAIAAMAKEGMQDWVPDQYYNSQNSFFDKDGKHYARVTIRKWEKNENQ